MHQDYYFTGDSTQDGILKAALETFAIFGYKKTAMSDISDRAGVSRPTLYTYFKNKESIFFAVTEGIHKSVIDEVQLALGPPATLEENLTSAFEEWTRPFMEVLFGLTYGQELIGAGGSVASNVSKNALSAFKAYFQIA